MFSTDTQMPKKTKGQLLNKLNQQKYLLLFVLPGMIWFLVLCYVPMAGLVLAFKEYDIATGVFHGEWVGLKYFRNFFNSYYFNIVIKNTVGISLIKLVLGFPIPIVFALLLNEVRCMKFKRVVQTVSYLPHFLSWVVALGILSKIFSVDGGLVNQILGYFGVRSINFFAERSFMWPLAYFSEMWKETGWQAIIYIAALAGIDDALYEAATIDGANRFQRIFSVSLPCISNTIITLLIISVGGIFSANFDQMYLLGIAPVRDVTEVIDTYIYRNNLKNFQYSLGTAVGLFKSAINVGLVFTVNYFSKRYTGNSLI